MTQIPQLELKNEVLLRIQKNFPLVKKPFLNIANELHTTEERVLEILNEAKRDGIIRQTSAIFDTKKLGWKQFLESELARLETGTDIHYAETMGAVK